LPQLMGILNATPDSFSDGRPEASVNDFVDTVSSLIDAGADIIDIGGESTRPGSLSVSTDEEIKRVIPLIQKIRDKFPDISISLDTRKYEVAKEAVSLGIQMINDTSFAADLRLPQLAKESKIPYVLMHSRSEPDDMMNHTDYGESLLQTLENEVNEKLQVLLNEVGLTKDEIILDPGFGFAKTPAQCQFMMAHLNFWKRFDVSLMFGVSRKRFLQQYIGTAEPVKRDEVSAMMAKVAARKGFMYLRVHNVAMTKEFINGE
jgi:dihydropteroate synthase